MNDDLISRQEAIDAYILHTMGYLEGKKPKRAFTEVLRELPSTQPEVIRCKDCKHYYFADNRVLSEQSWVCDAWGVDQTAHMGYCFKAERRSDG